MEEAQNSWKKFVTKVNSVSSIRESLCVHYVFHPGEVSHSFANFQSTLSPLFLAPFLPPPTLSLHPLLSQGSKRLDSGIVKDSMFSSPDEVAGKVGVVNSGKKMTDFGARKKHKFDTF